MSTKYLHDSRTKRTPNESVNANSGENLQNHNKGKERKAKEPSQEKSLARWFCYFQLRTCRTNQFGVPNDNGLYSLVTRFDMQFMSKVIKLTLS